ncbi:AMP-binding protein [Sinorhizobium medicae]|uniref:AMP-binding protein n=1 Tax=Sinorhizobium medicae TaxID=110321 RepID=UPI000FDAEAFA|nr:AMP-binding protein [Sinorhizobium medicae]MQW01264.1 AMP-binding protein [Sinorhizobium medicae]RVJ80375.1 AMP-dependent synthetase [Sinorhizobium medicae]WQO86950.1 AMP-binding protein [Sinorhizobium medicae]
MEVVAVDVDSSMSPMSVASLAARGERPALLLRGGSIITYRELAQRVGRLASQWRGGRGLVMLEAELSDHSIVGYLAALEAGHAVALCAGASMVTAREVFNPEYCYRRCDGRWRMERLDTDPVDPHPQLAVLLSTSGSTGYGKCVRLSYANIQSNALSIAGYLGLSASDRGCFTLPLHYSYGLSILNTHLSVGASVYLPGSSISDDGFLDDLAESGSSSFAGVPYSYDLLEKVGFRERDFPKLRFMTVAGGRMSPELVRRYDEHLSARGASFFVMYGQTEATARMAYMPPESLRGREDRIGIAIPGGSLTIVDEEGRTIQAADQAGELVYRGPNVMMGYASSRADLARGAELSELRTGDLASRDAEGYFRIVGRTKRLSKIAGLRIGHDSLEAALERHGISAAVVGNDTEVHAYYAGDRDPEEVCRLLLQASGLTAMQVGASRLNCLPRLVSGKIDYQSLAVPPAATQCRRFERQSVETVFARIFYPKKIRSEDSFLSLGGDSLRFVQLSIGLEKILGELPESWEKLPIGELAARSSRKGKIGQIATDLLIRALAIILVVLHHETLWPIPGGSAAMVILAGFSLARFQSGALFSGAIDKLLWPLAQVLIPYYLIVAAYALAWGEVPWASIFLVGNFAFADPERHSMVPYLYWFIEAYCQMLLVFGALFAVPSIRRAAAKRPFAAGMILFVAAFAARMAFPLLVEIGNRQIFTLPWIFYMAVLGWCAAIAATWKEKSAVMLAGTGVFLFLGLYEGVWIGTKIKYLLQIIVLAALLFLPRVRLPQWSARLILPLSAASFHIYILHRFVPELLLQPMQSLTSPVVFAVASILGGIALGAAAWLVQRQLVAWLAARESRILLAPRDGPGSGLASGSPLFAVGPQEEYQIQRQ